jgi:hypothetical protein
MKEFIYRWNGEYFGFLYNGRLFDKYSTYLGWVDENEVWKKDGTYFGEIIEGSYILRRTSMAARARRAIRAIPATPATPASRINRVAVSCAGSGVKLRRWHKIKSVRISLPNARH